MKDFKAVKNKVTLVAVLTLLLGMSSCFEDNFHFKDISTDFELKPGISIPVTYGNLNLKQILNKADLDSFVFEQPDHLLYISYENQLISYTAKDVITVPDQNFNPFVIAFDTPDPFLLPIPVGETMPIPLVLDSFGDLIFANDQIIDSLNLHTSRLEFHVTSGFHHEGTLLITAPGIIVNGVPYSKEILISDPSGAFSADIVENLSNVKVLFEHSGTSSRILPLKFNLTLKNSGAIVQPTEKCEINISLTLNTFSSIFGYLGVYDILAHTGQIDIPLFNEQAAGGEVFFFDPRFSLLIDNSYGMPAEIELRDVSTSSRTNNVTTPIVFNGVNPFEINSPDVSHIGQAETTEIPINKQNCNILEAIETSPNRINFSAYAKTNSEGVTGPYNFVTDSSHIDVSVKIILPVWIKAQGFALKDTMEFNVFEELGTETDMVDFFRVNLNVENGFPLEAKLQVYFADTDYAIIDSLFEDQEVLLDPANVDSNNEVVTPKKVSKTIELKGAEIEKIKETKYAIIKATLNTSSEGDGYFKFYSDYGIKFDIGARAKLIVNSNDL